VFILHALGLKTTMSVNRALPGLETSTYPAGLHPCLPMLAARLDHKNDCSMSALPSCVDGSELARAFFHVYSIGRCAHCSALATTNSGVSVTLAQMEFAMKQWASTLSMILRAGPSSASLLRVTWGRTATSVIWYFPSTFSSNPSASLIRPGSDLGLERA
jgi:hypothetical protein